MNRVIVLLFVSIYLGCNLNNGNLQQQYIFTESKGGAILYPYIMNGRISGTVNIDEVSKDTLINLKYDNPLLDVRVDSIYFYCFTKNVFKCLFKTPLGKGLAYIEEDRTGKYKIYQDFGGWVKSVSIIKAVDSGKETKLVFKVSSSGSFNFDYNGECTFRSSNSDISFYVKCKK